MKTLFNIVFVHSLEFYNHILLQDLTEMYYYYYYFERCKNTLVY